MSKDKGPKSPQPPVRTSADAALKKLSSTTGGENQANLSSDHSLNNQPSGAKANNTSAIEITNRGD